MLQSIGQKIEQGARRFLPLATSLLLVLIGAVAWPVPHMGVLSPSLGLIALYYWAMHRPDLLRLLDAFLLGVLGDVVNSTPFGVNALIFVAAHQIVLSQRRFFVGHSFAMLWTGFSLVAMLAAAAEWLLLSVLGWKIMAFAPVLAQRLFTIAVFPVPVWMLIRLQRSFLSQG